MSPLSKEDEQEQKRQRAVDFGVKAYVDTFDTPPPKTARDLEAQLHDLEDTFVSNPIQQAIDLAPYAEFVALVQAARQARTVH